MPELVKCSYCGNDVNADDIAICTPVYRSIEINMCKACHNRWLNASDKEIMYWAGKRLAIEINAIILAMRGIEKDIKKLEDKLEKGEKELYIGYKWAYLDLKNQIISRLSECEKYKIDDIAEEMRIFLKSTEKIEEKYGIPMEER